MSFSLFLVVLFRKVFVLSSKVNLQVCTKYEKKSTDSVQIIKIWLELVTYFLLFLFETMWGLNVMQDWITDQFESSFASSL